MEGLTEQHISESRTLTDFKKDIDPSIRYLLESTQDSPEGERQALLTYQLSTLSAIECGIIDPKDVDPQLGKLTAFDKFSKKGTLTQAIVETYHLYQWKEYYGLNVDEVLNLPFPIWLQRREFLLKKREEREKEKVHQQKEKEHEKMEKAELRKLLFQVLPNLAALSLGPSKNK